MDHIKIVPKSIHFGPQKNIKFSRKRTKFFQKVYSSKNSKIFQKIKNFSHSNKISLLEIDFDYMDTMLYFLEKILYFFGSSFAVFNNKIGRIFFSYFGINLNFLKIFLNFLRTIFIYFIFLMKFSKVFYSEKNFLLYSVTLNNN